MLGRRNRATLLGSAVTAVLVVVAYVYAYPLIVPAAAVALLLAGRACWSLGYVAALESTCSVLEIADDLDRTLALLDDAIAAAELAVLAIRTSETPDDPAVRSALNQLYGGLTEILHQR